MRRSVSQWFTLLCVLILGIGIGATFQAHVVAQPDRAGVIRACVNVETGIPRIVDADAPCTEAERVLEWNIQGPPGPPGQPGSVPTPIPSPTGVASFPESSTEHLPIPGPLLDLNPRLPTPTPPLSPIITGR
jgi:hypothetical protein